MTSNISRRDFLKFSGSASVLTQAAPLMLNLASMSQAAAANATDYKALVCVFLFGGNDQYNTLVPYDPVQFNNYQTLRPEPLQLKRSELLALPGFTQSPGGTVHEFALNPALAHLQNLFADNRMGVLLNVGTLRQPLTKQEFSKRKDLRPPKLFSHNDQQAYWLSSGAEGGSVGWGGTIADNLIQPGGLSDVPDAGLTCINLANDPLFLSSQGKAFSYAINLSGPVSSPAIQRGIEGSTKAGEVLRQLVYKPDGRPSTGHHMMNDLIRLYTRSIDLRSLIKDTLGIKFGEANRVLMPPVEDLSSYVGSETAQPLTPHPGFLRQLDVVAKMIEKGKAGAPNYPKRQVFLVGIGGFDFHNSLKDRQWPLLAGLGSGLRAFHDYLESIDASTNVTTFTASDFGRTWGNSSGSDHGWGSHHFIMGGALDFSKNPNKLASDGTTGSHFFGTPPQLANDGESDVGQGRLLPTTSTDQLAATLGKWMGVEQATMNSFLPNLANFSTKDLGFL